MFTLPPRQGELPRSLTRNSQRIEASSEASTFGSPQTFHSGLNGNEHWQRQLLVICKANSTASSSSKPQSEDSEGRQTFFVGGRGVIIIMRCDGLGCWVRLPRWRSPGAGLQQHHYRQWRGDLSSSLAWLSDGERHHQQLQAAARIGARRTLTWTAKSSLYPHWKLGKFSLCCDKLLWQI